MKVKTKDFSASAVPIGQILEKNYFFRVPSYQRPFSWDDDQFSDLIDDLTTAPVDKGYFLGTIVLHETEPEGNYDLVDGQQRMTSIMILLACLRDRIVSEEHKEAIQNKLLQKKNVLDNIPQKIRLEVKDTKVFNENIVEPNGTLKKQNLDNISEPQIRYFKAIQIFTAVTCP